MSTFAHVNHVQLHYYDRPGDEPALILLPGLTVNARIFDGLVAAGLGNGRRVIAVDMRGRGQSEKPDSGYHMRDHTDDVIALMDHLGLERAIPVGHSFGGLLAFCLAAWHPARIPEIVTIDASVLLVTERTRELIKSSLDRLEMTLPSMEAYLETMKQMPYLDGFWSEAMEAYYKGDVRQNPDGTVQPLASAQAIAQTVDLQFELDWEAVVKAVEQPVLLLNALGPYGPPGAPVLMPSDIAEKTVTSLKRCTYQVIEGNHITMIFGQGAQQIVSAIDDFLASTTGAA
jgi:pimeloyl-ACP methyl ester carboxylesterase